MSFFGQSPQQRFFTPLRSVLNDKKPTIATVAIPFFLSKLQGCGLRFGRKSPLQYATERISGATATCNPQLGLRFHFRWYHDVLRCTKHRFPLDNTSCCFTDGHEPSFIFQLRICRISLHSFGTSQALMQSSLSLFHLINLRRQIIPAIQKKC